MPKLAIELYFRIEDDGVNIRAAYHSVGIFGPLLGTTTSAVSAVVTLGQHAGAYLPGQKTLCCAESDEWTFSEFANVLATHQRIFSSRPWALDTPTKKMLRSLIGVKIRSLVDGDLKDSNVRAVMALLKDEWTGTIIVPAAFGRPHPGTAAVSADMKVFTPVSLATVTPRLLATAFCNFATRVRTHAVQLVNYTAADGRRYVITQEEAQRLWNGGPRPRPNGPPLPAEESSAMREARARGRYMQTTNFLSDLPKGKK